MSQQQAAPPAPHGTAGRKKWPRWAKITFWTIVGLTVFFIVIGALAGDPETTATEDTSASTPTAEASQKPTTEPTRKVAAPAKPAAKPKPAIVQLRERIGEALGDSNREGVQRVSDVSNSGGVVVVKWAINDNLTNGMIKTGAGMDVGKILKAARESGFSFKEIVVVGSFSMQDQYGNASESPVFRLGYSRSVVDKINYDAVDPKGLPGLADGVSFVHPAFQQ